MAENGSTTRDLLLQLNDKLTDFIAESKADRATLGVKIDSIKESCAIMNHNSTVLAERVGVLERGVQKGTDYRDFTIKLFATIGGVIASGAALATILYFLHVLI
jgi:hypothetical protein